MSKRRAVYHDHIGDIEIPKIINRCVEGNEDRLIVEQTAFDAVNGYAQGIGIKVRVQRLVHYCSICGYHSLKNPDQKKKEGETNHKLSHEYETIFYWDDYGPHNSLLDDFLEQTKGFYELKEASNE